MILVALGLIGQTTLPHTFVYEASSQLQSVHVAGTFNNWTIGADPMVNEKGSLRWTLRKELAPGQHQYKFVLNGNQWITDPKAEKNIDDGNGNTNSVLNLLTPEMRVVASRSDAVILTAALEHRAEAPYYFFDRGKVHFKLRARKGDLSKAGAKVGGRTYAMVHAESDDQFDWYRLTLPWKEGTGIRYSFTVTSGSKTEAYGDYRLSPAEVRAALIPDWPQHSVIYQIFPDRFANGNPTNDPAGVMPWDGEPTYANYFGGDIAGVKKEIPYLKSLGVKGIYFNPIFKSPSNHGYETTDYHLIEPRFGTNAEFSDLTRELRKNGIRTVLDGVFNHSATDFGPFADIVKNGETSKYRDWFFIKSYPVNVGDPPNYEAWFGFPSLPKINTGNPQAADYLQGVPKFWDERADIAGWRLDVANEVPMDFWRQFRKKVKSLGRDRWIVGEVWGDGSGWLNKNDQWDSIMGYQFRDAVLKYVANGTMTPAEYYRQLMRVHDSYPPAVSRNLMILLGSHDTPRILTLCRGDRALAKIAATLQLTWIGAPSIYYGDELGMEGDRDPDNRRGMRWDLARAQNAILFHYRRLISARNSSPALQSGDAKLLAVKDAALAYARSLGKETVVTAVNRGDQRVALPVSIPSGRYQNIFDTTVLLAKSGRANIVIPPKSSAVYQLTAR